MWEHKNDEKHKKRELIHMRYEDLSVSLSFTRARDKNSKNQMEKLNQFVNKGLVDIFDESFTEGFQDGAVHGKAEESVITRCRIIGSLLLKTKMTDEEIVEIIGFGEEGWLKTVGMLRSLYTEYYEENNAMEKSPASIGKPGRGYSQL
jgi:hypothetical protein